jgi:hypothetical protein
LWLREDAIERRLGEDDARGLRACRTRRSVHSSVHGRLRQRPFPPPAR